MTIIDMELLQKEILSKPGEAALPCNLSDYWIDEIASALEAIFEGDSITESSQLAAPLALVSHILGAKNEWKEMQLTWEELFEHFKNYRIELALEEIKRRTDMKSTPATLETIFSNRSIEILIDQENQ